LSSGRSISRTLPDQTLLIAVVADCGARSIKASRKRCIRDDATAPYRGDQIVLADHALAVADQVEKHVKGLRRQRNRIGALAQLPLVGVERKILEQIAHSVSLARTRSIIHARWRSQPAIMKM
jgi:hypothetical protein